MNTNRILVLAAASAITGISFAAGTGTAVRAPAPATVNPPPPAMGGTGTINRDAQPPIIREDVNLPPTPRPPQQAPLPPVGSSMVKAGEVPPSPSTRPVPRIPMPSNDRPPATQPAAGIISAPSGNLQGGSAIISAPGVGVVSAPSGVLQGNAPTVSVPATMPGGVVQGQNVSGTVSTGTVTSGTVTGGVAPGGWVSDDTVTSVPAPVPAPSTTVPPQSTAQPAASNLQGTEPARGRMEATIEPGPTDRIDVDREAHELLLTPTTRPTRRAQGGLSPQPPLARPPYEQPAAPHIQPQQPPPSGSNQSDVAR